MKSECQTKHNANTKYRIKMLWHVLFFIFLDFFNVNAAYIDTAIGMYNIVEKQMIYDKFGSLGIAVDDRQRKVINDRDIKKKKQQRCKRTEEVK